MPLSRWLAVCLAALAALAALPPARAQQPDTLTAEDGWVRDLTASLAASQAAYRDWQEGGVNALAATALAEAAFDRRVGLVRLHHEARAAFGVVQQDTLPVRKADDQVRYGFAAEWRGGLVRPAVGLTARSQFAPGYDVSPDSADYPTLTVVPGQALRVSAWGSPAVLTQSVGVALHPGGGVTGRVGVALKETLVGIARLRPLFGNAPDQFLRFQAGLDAEVRVDRPLVSNVRLRSRATFFQAFNEVGDVAPDVLGEATLLLRVNTLLQVTLNGAALYDADVLDRLQLRQSLAVGLTLDLL